MTEQPEVQAELRSVLGRVYTSLGVYDKATALLEKARAIPGAKHVGVTTYLPFSGNNNSSVFVIDGRPLAR